MKQRDTSEPGKDEPAAPGKPGLPLIGGLAVLVVVLAVGGWLAVRSHPAPEPPQPERRSPEAALETIRTALNRMPCTIFKTEVTADGAVAVRGAVDEMSSETRVRALIESVAPGAAYTLKTETVNRIMCDPLAVIGRPRDRNQHLPRPLAVQPMNQGALYKNGQNLILDVHGPDFPTYLQVDYFTLEGFAVHLLPNAKDSDHRLAAGGVRRLGDPTADGRFWTVAQPFGRELIVAIATARPLFSAPRPDAENAAGYLADLRKALDAAGQDAGQDGGQAPVAVAMFITTVPN